MKKLLLVLLLVSAGFAQTTDPNVILNKVQDAFDKVKDYSVDVDIKVDVSFLKVPEMKAEVFFKQPEKFKIKSDGFAMLPKQTMNFSTTSLLNEKYTAIYQKEDTLNGIRASVIKVIPLNEKSDVVLTTLWIDQKKNEILKAESTTKVNGTYTINFSYNDNLKYPLPSSILFSFPADNLKRRPRRENSEEETKQKNNNKENATGKVFINYSNYRVNKGIPDSVFEEPQKGENNK